MLVMTFLPKGLIKPLREAGFTLVELVIGIAVLALSLVMITGVLGPLYKKSSDPWHQVRAAELGQSFLNEIMARSFDEHSDRAGGSFRCDANSALEPGAKPCSTPIAAQGRRLFPADSEAGGIETRLQFDDVDDFDGYDSLANPFTSLVDSELQQRYRQYRVRVRVIYDGNFDGVQEACAFAASACLSERRAKLVTVTVTTPSAQDIAFSAYKGNW